MDETANGPTMIKQISAWETVKSIGDGLLPWAGDLDDLRELLARLWDAAWLVLRLVYRLTALLIFPLSIVLLYPLVRAAQRRVIAEQESENKRRAELVADLTKLTSKPVDWPHDWKLK